MGSPLSRGRGSDPFWNSLLQDCVYNAASEILGEVTGPGQAQSNEVSMHVTDRLLFATLIASLLFIGFPIAARAEVGDPTLETNHPYYSGEGAFQSIAQCVERATRGKATTQDKAIALYLWLLAHQFHLASPEEWNVPGQVPDTNRDDSDMIVHDANRARFSYGYGLCGTVHAWNEPYWKALGLKARRRAFPGHTNSEIEYDRSWHTFDTDMAGLVFRKDGVVAGYEDIIKDLSCLANDRSPLPHYPFAWPEDFQVMQAGWKEVARGGNWFKLYHGGYAAHPGIVHLRAGETFTRYFDRDHFGGPAKRRFWHHLDGGPFRDWTFVNIGPTEHQGARSNCRGNASYCNGEFVYRPDLSKASYREGVIEQTGNVAGGQERPGLRSKDGNAAGVTFGHFSPYVICGEPADRANPMSGHATSGLVISGRTTGRLALKLSVDQGQTWQAVSEEEGNFTRDLTDAVKGRYGWQARFEWSGADGLDALTFTTTVQAAQAIYPRLKPGGCTVTYRAGSRAVVPVLPNFGAAESVIASLEDKSRRAAGVVYTGRGPASRTAYHVNGNKPGEVVFRVRAPARLLQVSAAARFTVRVPPPDGCDYHLDISADGGKTWKPLARADIPKDNDFSSGWVYGDADLAAADTQNALVRVHFYAGGYPAGLIAGEMYGVYATASPEALSLTYAWREDGTVKTHREEIPAGTKAHTFHVPTGKSVVDSYVRLEAP